MAMSSKQTPQNKRKSFAFLALSFIAIGFVFMRGNPVIAANENKPPFIATGGPHSFVIDSGGKIHAAGSNDFGQLGLGDSGHASNRHSFTRVASLNRKDIAAIAVGGAHSLALSRDGKVYGAGWSNNGELGLGVDYPETFTLVPSLEGKNIVAIAASIAHSLALGADGELYATGYNKNGELGLGDAENRYIFTPVSSPGDKKIAAIAAGVYYSFAIDANGDVYAAGDNFIAQLGLDEREYGTKLSVFTLVPSLAGKNIVAIAAADFHSLALSRSGDVYATGMNDDGQLGLGDNDIRQSFTLVSSLRDKKIVAIAAGDRYSLALDGEGKVYGAGGNSDGQLGFGDKKYRHTFALVPSLEGKHIVAIAASYTLNPHALALDADGRVYATGDNRFGQLGLGDTNARDGFTLVPLPDR
jgi:alpha-tubulin suppressor-like RCC1 family protein